MRSGLNDETDEILITLWKKSLIESIEEETCYVITDLNVKQYYGLKLSSIKNVIVEKQEKLSLFNKPDLLKNNQSEVMETEKTLHHPKITFMILTAKPMSKKGPKWVKAKVFLIFQRKLSLIFIANILE